MAKIINFINPNNEKINKLIEEPFQLSLDFNLNKKIIIVSVNDLSKLFVQDVVDVYNIEMVIDTRIANSFDDLSLTKLYHMIKSKKIKYLKIDTSQNDDFLQKYLLDHIANLENTVLILSWSSNIDFIQESIAKKINKIKKNHNILIYDAKKETKAKLISII